ncbi:WYL domain-containing protein, partial [Streptomyces sp. NPDC059152]
ALHQDTARLRISPQARRLLPMLYGAVGRRALEDAGEPDADGWTVVEMPVEGPAVAVGDLLRLGAEAEVLGPPALRRAVAEAVAVLAGRYGAAPGTRE